MHQSPKQEPSKQQTPIFESVTTSTLAHGNITIRATHKLLLKCAVSTCEHARDKNLQTQWDDDDQWARESIVQDANLAPLKKQRLSLPQFINGVEQ